MGNNILDGLQIQIDRCSELLITYNNIQSGLIAAVILKDSIKRAKEALTSGDVIECIQAYKELTGIQ